MAQTFTYTATHSYTDPEGNVGYCRVLHNYTGVDGSKLCSIHLYHSLQMFGERGPFVVFNIPQEAVKPLPQPMTVTHRR